MFSAVFALVLVAASVALLLFIVSLLFNAIHLPLGGAIERRRFAQSQERARRGDKVLGNGDVPRALEEFRKAFYLDAIVSDRTLLAQVHNHHTGLLSRLIAVTEEVHGGIRLMSLAKADRLLNERTDLQRRYFRARDGNLSAGQPRELYGKLRTNRHELQLCLRQLVGEIATQRAGERYH
jgi:hypothetical protein